MTESVVEVKPPSKVGPFPQYPEGSDMFGIRPILEKNSALSRRSKIRIPSEDKGFQRVSERPDALRRTRRELVEEITPYTSRDEKAAIIESAHARDQLAEEFMANQQEIKVDLGDLGEQTARYVVLTPPEGRRTEETDSKPPIFLIAGTSNDLESMGMLPQEAAFSGRTIITIAYPESWQGNVTDAFGKAAEESPNYEPHTSFFKGAIKKIMNEDPALKEKLGDFPEIELWGFSAGAAMVTEILQDPNFQEMVSNAAIIAPPNNVDQKNVKIFNQEIPIPKDMIYELWQIFKPSHLKDAPKINVSNRGKIEYTEDKRKRMTRTYNALRAKVLRRNQWWEKDMQVKEGGAIIVVSYDKDTITKSNQAIDEIKQNPSLRVVELPGSHVTPRTEPEALINAISKITTSVATAT